VVGVVKRYAVALLVAAGLVITPGSASAAPINDETMTSAVSGRIRKVIVRNEIGSVVVVPGASASVKRTLRWNFSKPSYSQTLADGVLSVRAHCPDFPFNECSTHLVVVVPRTTEVGVGVVNGSAKISRFAGRSVAAAVNNGMLTLSDLASPVVRADSNNGEVRVSFLRKPAKVALTNDNGDVLAWLPRGAYDIQTKTRNGAVSVKGLSDVSGTARKVWAQTTNGDVILRGR
jgi:hypothetical protein